MSDGSTETFSANIIAELLYSQVDSEGHEHVLLKEIIDHRSNGSAVPMDDAYWNAKAPVFR
jgi:hypothetical protein